MLSVHLAFDNDQLRQGLSLLLKASGLPQGEAHRTGSAIIRAVRKRGGGLVLCGEKLIDMTPQLLHESLGDEALVVVLQCSPAFLWQESASFMRLVMPLSPRELADRVRQLLQAEEIRQRSRRRPRTQGEEDTIEKAKLRLISRLGIDENEAHRMLQQASMRRGQRMALVAEEILKV